MNSSLPEHLPAIATFVAVLSLAPQAKANLDSAELLAQLDQYQQEVKAGELAQVNSVFQLRDVAPSDWAFDALRNLVEKYNCIVGYPNGTFRGDRPLSRYEFAAGLNPVCNKLSD
ncbi:MAG: iron uptake porin [Limnothrix sp.]